MDTWWRHQMENFSALLAICAGNSPITGELSSQSQWRGALMFSLICAWIKGWVNNREAGDLRRHRTHYDVIVMISDEWMVGLMDVAPVSSSRFCWNRNEYMHSEMYVSITWRQHRIKMHRGNMSSTGSWKIHHLGPLSLTWFNFNPSMDK